ADESGGCGFERGRAGRDLDNLLLLRDAKLDIEVGGPGDGHFDLVQLLGFETRLGDGENVPADREIGEGVLPLGVRDGGAREAGRRAIELNSRAGDGGPGGVGDYAGDAAAEGLRGESDGEEKENG